VEKTKLKKVLIVDDVFQIRHSLGQYLNETGFLASEAGSGAEGLMMYKKILPDLILLDYNMRDMDCFQFLEMLRDFKNNMKDIIRINNAPAIVMSGYTIEKKVRELSKKYGIVDFVPKPLDLISIPEIIKSVLCEKRERPAQMTKDIVILDGETRTTDFLANYFAQLDYSVSCFNDPEKFVDRVQVTGPDIVLIDTSAAIGSESDSGINYGVTIGLIGIVKKRNPDTIIYVTSQFIDAALKETFKESGVKDILIKPFDLEWLQKEFAAIRLNTIKKSVTSG
jgi:CheY-like chemotaxis protein